MEITKEQQLMQEIINKAWEDETFKKELQINPMETIHKLTGKSIKVPEGKKLIVRDQTAEGVIYINIPFKQNLEDIELNDEQLEIVSGGGPIKFPWGGGTGPTFPDPETILFESY